MGTKYRDSAEWKNLVTKVAQMINSVIETAPGSPDWDALLVEFEDDVELELGQR
jgi:hypothetical protein